MNQMRWYLSTINLLTRAELLALKKLLVFFVFTGIVLTILLFSIQ